jgi:hypothetical protein
MPAYFGSLSGEEVSIVQIEKGRSKILKSVNLVPLVNAVTLERKEFNSERRKTS